MAPKWTPLGDQTPVEMKVAERYYANFGTAT
jgi:hypothetical protein